MSGTPTEQNVLRQLMAVAKSDPISFMSTIIVLIGFAIYEPVIALSTLVGIGIMGFTYQIYQWRTTPHQKTARQKYASKTSSTSSSSPSTPLKSVWDFNRALGRDAKGPTKKSDHDDKPFGSSYYYAHNNPNATGGYRDGLKMEDYTMNGPRLLSKGGKAVNEQQESTEVAHSSSSASGDVNNEGISEKLAGSAAPEENQASAAITNKPPTSITKYLWDDPGTGIATIRIDQLPLGAIGGKGGRKGLGDMIDWKDAQVRDVSSRLAGEGLLVKIETEEYGLYQLKISKLYGDAAKVECIRKTKRLLVKIHKKKNAVLSWISSGSNKSNIDSWPQPHRKV